MAKCHLQSQKDMMFTAEQPALNWAKPKAPGCQRAKPKAPAHQQAKPGSGLGFPSHLLSPPAGLGGGIK